MEFHAGFTLAVSQNRFLSTQDTEMQAVLTVTSAGLAGADAPDR